jgi:hypothetical protein
MDACASSRESLADADRQDPGRNTLATASLVLGILSVLMVALSWRWKLPLFWITSVPAAVLGYLGMRKVSQSFTEVSGFARARAGFRLGLIVTLVLPLGAAIAIPLASKAGKKGEQARTINHCRMIMVCLRLYSPDNCGSYPDAVPTVTNTSNEVFRTLFIAGVANDESIFGCDSSPFKPDGKIGASPDFNEALKKGENHWAMTHGLTDSSPGNFPLVYENPATAAGVPKWNADAAGMAKPGRCWSDGNVAIGFNDGSVEFRALEAKHGKEVPLASNGDGSAAFWPASSGSSASLEVLNVDR